MKKIKVSLYFLLTIILTMSILTFTVSLSEDSREAEWKKISPDNPETEWKKFFQSYLASVGIGAVSGVVADKIAEYLLESIIKPHIGQDRSLVSILKRYPNFVIFLEAIIKPCTVKDKSFVSILKKYPNFVTFLIAFPIKIAMLNNIKKDMLKYNIPFKNYLMSLTVLVTPFRGHLKDACLPFFQSGAYTMLPTSVKFLCDVFLGFLETQKDKSNERSSKNNKCN